MSDTESEPIIEKPAPVKKERTPAQLAAFEKARAKMLAQREARLADKKTKPTPFKEQEPETPKRKSKTKQKIIIEDDDDDYDDDYEDEPEQTIIVKRKSKKKTKPKVIYESEDENEVTHDPQGLARVHKHPVEEIKPPPPMVIDASQLFTHGLRFV